MFTKSNLGASVPPQARFYSRNGHETSRIPHAETSLEVLQIHRTRAPQNRRVVRIILLQCLHGKCLGRRFGGGGFRGHVAGNLAISIVTPIFNKPVDLFHNKKKPDVVIIANGGCWTSESRSSMHFTATSLLDKHVKLPGSEKASTNPNVDTPPKLEPTILIDKTKAKQLGIQEYIKEEKVKTLQMLRSVTKTLNRMNSHIADLITESDDFIEQKKIMEYKLEKIRR